MDQTATTYDSQAYARGWKASQGAGSGALDRADARREPNEWYDGYTDYAVGDAKWTRRDNPAQATR